jgi:cytochrome c-type biogenesis protein CcmH
MTRLLLAVLLAGGAARAGSQQPASRAGQDSVARLWRPGVVQEREATTAAHNDSLVRAIEHRLKCTCGCNLDIYTCRTTDFTCATSPAMHRAVVARLDSALAAGYDQARAAAEVVRGFELQYGQIVLMAPPKRGFNWAAYIIPFVGLGAGIGIVVGLMRHWMRGRAFVPAEDAGAGAAGPAPSDAERLRRELERFEA